MGLVVFFCVTTIVLVPIGGLIYRIAIWAKSGIWPTVALGDVLVPLGLPGLISQEWIGIQNAYAWILDTGIEVASFLLGLAVMFLAIWASERNPDVAPNIDRKETPASDEHWKSIYERMGLAWERWKRDA